MKFGEELQIRSEGSSLEKVSLFVSATFASWDWHFSIISWEADIVAQDHEKFKEFDISLLEHLEAEEEEEQEEQEEHKTRDLWTYEILYCFDVLLKNNVYAGQYKPIYHICISVLVLWRPGLCSMKNLLKKLPTRIEWKH